MRHIESDIQQICVRWFRYMHPSLSPVFFAVPNGGKRSQREAAIMKGEGVLAGVADLLLLYPSMGYHGLAIEMKTLHGRQSPFQKEWQKEVEKHGYRYEICRSFDDFEALINEYVGKVEP